MSTLDEKLKELLIDISELPDDFISDSDVEAIKQAFIDEGWMKPQVTTYTNGYSHPITPNDGDLIPAYDNIRMTGPEYLARFEKEYPLIVHQLVLYREDYWKAEDVMKAAKRAAGVDE